MAIIPELARGLCTLLTPSLLAGARDKHGRARQDPKAKRERKRWCTGLTWDISGVTFVPWCGAHLLDSNSARRAGSTPRCCEEQWLPGCSSPGGRSRTRSARGETTAGWDEHNQSCYRPHSLESGILPASVAAVLGSLDALHIPTRAAALSSPEGDSPAIAHNKIYKTALISPC